MKSKRLLLLAVLFVFGISVFGSVKGQAAGAVKLNKQNVVIEMGSKEQLEMENTGSKVKWSSDNKNIVKVNKGVLTPVAVGSTKVTAKVNGKKYVCRVTVADYSNMSIEQKKVVSFALQYVGNRYQYGGTSLTKGVDCSGFTMAVYKEFGYELYHNAYRQLKETKSVKMKNIKAGDLIFYGTSKRNCSHVALYIGNGKVVHASTESTGIVISDYNYRNYVAVGRVLDTATYPDETEQGSVTRTAAAK